MPCKIEIKQRLQKQVEEISQAGIGMKFAFATVKAKQINKQFGHTVVSFFEGETDYTNKRVIYIPEELVDKYYASELILEEEEARKVQIEDNARTGEEYTDDYLFQKSSTPSITISPKTISMLKDFIKRIGVDIKLVDNIVVNGVKTDNNGVARLMQQLIEVVEGKETQALPEEAMHFVVAILKQTNKPLYNKLLSEINGYQILSEVFNTYGSDYLTKDGKPDVIKLKEEAIAKVLAQIVINKAENTNESPELINKTLSWWEKIIDYLKGLFIKSGFDRAAMDVLLGKDIGMANVITEDQEFLQKERQAEIFDNLKNIASQITLTNDEYFIDGKKIPKRVSEFVKSWYHLKFENKELTKTEYDKAVDDLKAEMGTAGHDVFEYTFHLLVDENGYLRERSLDDSDYETVNPKISREMYEEVLRPNLEARINSFPKGTRFMSEITVYDPKRGVAGTIDFLAIEPTGKINVLDWKFINLNTERYKDVPWYKVNAWNEQMKQYVKILQDRYGVKYEELGQKRMIPILTRYSKGSVKNKIMPKLLEIEIGAVNPKDVYDDYLLPVGMEDEKTGNDKIDKFLEKLNAEYQRLSEKSVLPSEKEYKAEELNALYKGIRHLQIKGDIKALLYQAKVLNLQIDRLINEYKTTFQGKDSSLFTEERRNKFSRDVEDYDAAINIYTDLDISLKTLFSESEEDKELKQDVRDTVDNARNLQIELSELFGEFVEQQIAGSEKVFGLLSPEKVIKNIFSKYFSTTATLQLKSLEVLFKKANRALGVAAMKTVDENKKLEIIKEVYDGWAKSKGLSKKNYFNIIKKKDSNELIDEYNPEFYKTLKKKIAEKDFEWIKDNIDINKYEEFLKEKLEKEVQATIDNNTEEEITYETKYIIEQLKRLYNTSTPTSNGWLLYKLIRNFPKEKWLSEEWKILNQPENKPAKDFYDYIREINNNYRDLGYISKSEARTFLPFVRKGIIEKLITGGNFMLGERFFRTISVDEGDIGYGKQDPLTGKLIDTIPKYFTNELEGEISTDLFKTISMYNEAAIRYKYIKDIEYQTRALIAIERNKKAIATSMFGKTQYKNGELQYTHDNSENTKLLEDMMKAIIYDQRYITSESFDQLLGKLGKWGETFNKKLGVKVFPENLSERQLSVNKIITRLNNIFQLNTLGLNLLSASSNLFGGNFQSMINAGTYFTKLDYLAAEGTIFINKFNGTEKKKMIGALEYFLPLTENYNRELAKRLSIHNLTNESLQDGLMYFMRQSDWNVQTANFYAYLRNTVVIDNEVLNVREYLRKQKKYINRHEGTNEQRKSLKDEFEKDVQSLIDEKGLMKFVEIIDDKFTIKGVEQTSNSVIELRRKIQQINKDALGNLTADDLRKINMNIYGKSFMVFKNWIPRLIDVRMGNLKYNSAYEAYEWGRTRMIMRVISQDLFHSIGKLHNILAANDKGVDFLRKFYEEKAEDYKLDTGKILNMTEADFMDLVRNNVKNQLIDVIFLTTMFLLVAGLKNSLPDDEDPVVKNQYNFMVRALDKFKGELTYFYDPTSLQGLISKGIFPSLALIQNVNKGLRNFMIENWAIAIGDEKLEESNKVIKYWMKTFPFTNQMIGYLPMFYPDMAKDMGVRIQSDYTIKK